MKSYIAITCDNTGQAKFRILGLVNGFWRVWKFHRTYITDLRSFTNPPYREVMSLKHSEERLRATYVELVKKNGQLEEKLLEQDGRHEEQKQKFERSIMRLTDKLILQRKKSEELEQANARAVRDCR